MVFYASASIDKGFAEHRPRQESKRKARDNMLCSDSVLSFKAKDIDIASALVNHLSHSQIVKSAARCVVLLRDLITAGDPDAVVNARGAADSNLGTRKGHRDRWREVCPTYVVTLGI